MRVALAALASGLLLTTGCGVASTQFHPGLAAEVDGDSVTTDQVDTATTGFCKYLINEGTVLTTPVSLRSLRSQIAAQLTLVEAATQVAHERDVDAGGALYRQARASAEDDDDNNSGLDDDELSAVVDLNASSAYLGDIINELGAQVAKDQGKKIPTDAQAANNLTFPLGAKELGGWITSHHVEIDPRYDIQLGVVGGELAAVPTDEGISFAQGPVARAGLTAALAKQADPEAVAALPDSQKCGGGGATGPDGGALPSDAPLPSEATQAPAPQ